MDKKLPRDKRRKVTLQEFVQVEADANSALKILNGEEFKFFRDYLVTEKELIVSDFVNNRIHKTTEVIDRQNGSKLEIEHTKEEQMAELSGRFKFIFDLTRYLENVVNNLEELKRLEKEGKIIIEKK